MKREYTLIMADKNTGKQIALKYTPPEPGSGRDINVRKAKDNLADWFSDELDARLLKNTDSGEN